MNIDFPTDGYNSIQSVPDLSGKNFGGGGGGSQNLQEVTDLGSTTTNPIEAQSFITTGGTSADFVKGDGSLGSVDLSGYVPYTGATTNLNLGANNLTVDTNTFFVDATSNNVGIGTISPPARLSVNANNASFTPVAIGGNSDFVATFADNFNGISGAQMGNVSTGTSADFRFLIKDNTGHYFTFSQPGENNNASIFGFVRKTADLIFNAGGTGRNLVIGTGSNHVLALGTNSNERMRIDGTGNVGIGTTAPVYGLHMVGNTANSSTFVAERIENSANPSGFWGLSGRGTKSAITAVQANDQLFRFIGGGYHSSSASHNSGEMTFAAAQNFTASNAGTDFFIALAPNNSKTRVERFRITQAGNVGIGTSNPDAPLHIEKGGDGILITGGTNNRYTRLDASSLRMYSTTLHGWAQGFIHYDNAGNSFGTSAGAFGITNTLSYFYYGGTFGDPGITILPNKNVGIGTTSPSARLHAISTTEQLRVGYNTSNYFNATVGSTGTTTFNAVGSGSKFVFSDNVELTQTVTTEAVVSDTTVTVVINGTTYKLLARA